MKNYNFVNTPYIAPVNLEILGKTFDTLEQGHQNAVKTASELKTTIANLPMNEQEDDFKQQLINEIENTIDYNTTYGNSYAALDDLITKAGDIMSDGRVIGRLRNQAAKEEYDAKVDAMAISEGMKQMYKEENPYIYVEGEIDERTGKTVPGELWKPKTNPVATVSPTEIQNYALQIAAEESGSYQTITFLDKNGKPTSNAEESVDGLIYQQIGTTYQKLSKEKIAEAYRIAINSIPGAEDSLRQDFKYAKWQYDKLVEKNKQENGDTTPYVPGFTDRDGNIYTYDQWLDNKINEFSDKSAYNRIRSDINFGTALQNFRIAQNNSNSGYVSNNGIILNGDEEGFGTFVAGYEKVEVDSFAGAQNAKTDAENTALSVISGIEEFNDKSLQNIINDLINNGQISKPEDFANYVISKYKLSSNDDIIQLNNAIVGYLSANQQMNSMLNVKGVDKDALYFSSDIANNTFTNNNGYSKTIIAQLNAIYSSNQHITVAVGSQLLDHVANAYNTDIEGLKQLGFNIVKQVDGNYKVLIDANHRNLLPRFLDEVTIANDIIPGTFGGWSKNAFTDGVSDTNYKILPHKATHPFYNVSGLRQTYKDGKNAAIKAESKAGVSEGYITVEGYDEGSFAAMYYRQSGAYTVSELKNQIQQANNRVDNMFANAQIDAGNIKIIKNSYIEEKDINKNRKIRDLIQTMYSSNELKTKIKRSCIIPNATYPGQPKGYKLTFTVPKGYGDDDFPEGTLVNVIIEGVLGEEKNFDPSYNPNILATNAIHVAKATGSDIENLGYNNWLGNTRISQIDDNTYNTSMFGVNKTINAKDAEKLIVNIITLQQIKANYLAGVYNTSNEHLQLLGASVEKIIDEINNILNTNPNYISQAIANYLTKE